MKLRLAWKKNADLWSRYVWKKNTEALHMLVEMWSMGILDREAPIDLFPYRKSKMFGNKIQHFEQDMICFKRIKNKTSFVFLMCFSNSYRIFSCCFNLQLFIFNFFYTLVYLPHFYLKLVNVYFMLKTYCNKVLVNSIINCFN